MNNLYFITGNAHKLDEAKKVLGSSLQSIKLDLDEIQSMDPKLVITHKLNEVIKVHKDKHLFCEDVSFEIESLNGFPGPLVKWWNNTLGIDLIFKIVSNLNKKPNAAAVATIGYWDTKKMHFFEGRINGTLVAPRGESGFGFDPIFQPEHHTLTFAQMDTGEKAQISHRARALKSFQQFLKSQ